MQDILHQLEKEQISVTPTQSQSFSSEEPKSIDSVIEQDTTEQKYSRTLNRAEYKNRIISVLFCGGRGTGKTSCARILAKTLACQNPLEGDPCGVCKNCNALS